MAEGEGGGGFLDPIKEMGVVKGGASLVSQMMPGALTGGAFQGRATDGISVGDVFSTLGDFAHEAAYAVPGIGEALGGKMAWDAFTSETDFFTKAVSSMGILGIPAMGGAIAAPRVRRSGFRPRGATDQLPVTLGYHDSSILAGLSGTPLEDAAARRSLYMTMDPRRTGVMRAAENTGEVFQPSERYKAMASSLTVDGAENPQLEHLMGTMGERYMTHPDAQQSLLEPGMNAQVTEVGMVATEFSKWDTAISTNKLTGGDAAAGAWKKLTQGGELDMQEISDLSAGLDRFGMITAGNGHPELAMKDVLWGVSSIGIDPEDTHLKLSYLAMDVMKISEATKGEVQKRAGLMLNMRSEAMVPLMTQNVVDFFTEHVSDVKQWNKLKKAVNGNGWAADWYAIARKSTFKEADRLGFDRDLLIGLASLTSAGELWEQNIEKAVHAAKLIQKFGVDGAWMKNPAKVAEWKYWLSKGDGITHGNANGRRFKYTDSEIENVFNLYGEWVDTGDSLQYFERMIGGKDALKQPNFTLGIRYSSQADARKAVAAERFLMDGNIAAADKIMGGDQLRLPLVADRHSYAVALGFSLEPSGQMTKAAGYNAVRAAHIAAADMIGEIPGLGRAMTPSELQAITWVAWREMKGTTKGFKPTLNNPNDWVPGQGPGFKTNDRILSSILGGGSETRAQWAGEAGKPLPPVSPEMLQGREVGKLRQYSGHQKDVREYKLKVDEFGENWVGSEGPPPNMTPSVAVDANGDRIYTSVKAQWVDNVEDQYIFIQNPTATDDGGLWTGARLKSHGHRMLANEDGNAIAISIPDRGTNLGVDTVKALQRAEREMREADIDVILNMQPRHRGLASVEVDAAGNKYWNDKDIPEGTPTKVSADLEGEMMQEGIFDFGSKKDLDAAILFMKEEMALQGDVATMDGVFTQAAAKSASSYIQSYGRKHDLSVPMPLRRVTGSGEAMARATPEVPTSYLRKLAKLYKGTPTDVQAQLSDPKVRRSWDAFGAQIEDQFDHLVRKEGVKVVVVDYDPYDGPAAMLKDVQDNQTLKVLSTKSTGGHPVLGDELNDKFRAVHDYYGHMSTGVNFTRHGETLAAAKHLQMFSDSARPAVAFDLMAANAHLVEGAATRKSYLKTLAKIDPRFEEVARKNSVPTDARLAKMMGTDWVDVESGRVIKSKQKATIRETAQTKPVKAVASELKVGDRVSRPGKDVIYTVKSAEKVDDGVSLTFHEGDLADVKIDPPDAAWRIHGNDGEQFMWGEVELGDVRRKPEGRWNDHEGVFAPEQKAGIVPDELMITADPDLAKMVYQTEGNFQGRRIDEWFGEDVLDVVAYTEDGIAPPGMTDAMEHLYKDPSGRVLSHNSTGGDINARNSRRVHLMDDDNGLRSYVETPPSAAIVPGEGVYSFDVKKSGRTVFGRVLEVDSASAEGLKKTGPNSLETARHIFDVKHGGKVPKMIAMYIPEEPGKMPLLAYNVDSVPGRDPSRTVVLRKTPGNYEAGLAKIEIETPQGAKGMVNTQLHQEAQDALDASGWSGPPATGSFR